MEDDKYWRSRASDMRERAAHTKDPFVSGGFIALAEQYDLLAQDGARWIEGSTSPYAQGHVETLPAGLEPTHRFTRR
jgi:hypothetical protein